MHNVGGGILNLYVTLVPGVMKHGRCNVIKYYFAIRRNPIYFTKRVKYFLSFAVHLHRYIRRDNRDLMSNDCDLTFETKPDSEERVSAQHLIELKKKNTKESIHVFLYFKIRNLIEI